MMSTVTGDRPAGRQDLVWTRDGLVPIAGGKEKKASTSRAHPVQPVQLLKRKMEPEKADDRPVGKLSEKALLRQKLKELDKDLISDKDDSVEKDVAIQD